MTPNKILRTAAALAVLAAPTVLLPGQAQASTYACRGIAAPGIDVVEGTDGGFYRIDPDLHSDHWIAERTLAEIAALSQALAAGGTTLVVLPVPTKALAMPETLPSVAGHAGYAPDLAASVYAENIRRLRDRGVIAADGRAAMRQLATTGTAPFPAHDTRPSPEGLRALAGAVGTALSEAGQTPRAPQAFTTTQVGNHRILSPLRTRLQRHCARELPPVIGTSWSTVPAGNATPTPGDSVAITGSGLTGVAGGNFAGFVSQATGRAAQALNIDGEDPFAAISSYLTSAAFLAQRPGVLVWEFPVWADLGARGDQPMAELIAAATASCTVTLDLAAGSAPGRLQASLRAVPAAANRVLMLDAGGTAPGSVAFRFTAEDGAQRVKSIYRAPGHVLGGRFYLPLTGLWPQGATGVEIQTATGFGGLPRLTVCDLPEVTL
ncbi:alginate O-acetyltransferase AlgX-related protein [Jannaschia sp. M317]|uniref:alginate O-acetyltransferase AlgX-related protein n=1 Tax=Jannaschia sp. M317 TaxID=2867011 RepID=UPI0021A8BAFA|nr:hypothetical protein [Jannaschia sp. M317]UWQ19663.1 hypothetical protein K3551_18090 [Jannaschia sp. M317]